MNSSTILSRNLKRFRCITFDVTDTILSFKKSPAIQYKETAEECGIKTIDEQKAKTLFKPCFKDLSKRYPNFGSGSEYDWNMWWTELVCAVLNQSSTEKLNQSLVKRVARHLVTLYETKACWKFESGAQELIQELHQTGKCLGIISNFDPRLKFLLENMGLKEFQFILSSYEAGYMKPDIRIFEAAMKRSKLSNLRAESCLHIGNKSDIDVKGALNAGWSAVLIDAEAEPSKSSNKKFKSFSSLDEFLQELKTKEIQWP